jgi:hypothetical protein
MSDDRNTPTSVAGSDVEEGVSTRPDLLRVGILGLNAWAVGVLLPTFHVGLANGLEGLAAVAPLGMLAAGVALLSRGSPHARWVLLAGVPPALVISAALRNAALVDDAFDAISLSLAAISLLAYLAASAHAVARPALSKPAIAIPEAEPLARRWLRRALLGLTSVGAFGAVVVAPAWATLRERRAAWGEAADAASVLTAVVAAVVTAFAVGSIVGPALRAERARPSAALSSRRRLAVAILFGTVAGIAWMVLTHFDPPR